MTEGIDFIAIRKGAGIRQICPVASDLSFRHFIFKVFELIFWHTAAHHRETKAFLDVILDSETQFRKFCREYTASNYSILPLMYPSFPAVPKIWDEPSIHGFPASIKFSPFLPPYSLTFHALQRFRAPLSEYQ